MDTLTTLAVDVGCLDTWSRVGTVNIATEYRRKPRYGPRVEVSISSASFRKTLDLINGV
jgi:hypothetical protein